MINYCQIGCFGVECQAMEKEEMEQTFEYLTELKYTIFDFNIRPASLQGKLAKLNETITELTVSGVQTEDKFERGRLAFLEMQARHCRECLLIRMEKIID